MQLDVTDDRGEVVPLSAADVSFGGPAAPLSGSRAYLERGALVGEGRGGGAGAAGTVPAHELRDT